jgi:hypothetical protein
MKQDTQKLGTLLVRMKSLPISFEGTKPEDWAQMQATALQEIYGWDGTAFDAKWREFVLETYPKK